MDDIIPLPVTSGGVKYAAFEISLSIEANNISYYLVHVYGNSIAYHIWSHSSMISIVNGIIFIARFSCTLQGKLNY